MVPIYICIWEIYPDSLHKPTMELDMRVEFHKFNENTFKFLSMQEISNWRKLEMNESERKVKEVRGEQQT